MSGPPLAWLGWSGAVFASLAVGAGVVAIGRRMDAAILGRLSSTASTPGRSHRRHLSVVASRIGSWRWVGVIGRQERLARNLAMSGRAGGVEEFLGWRIVLAVPGVTLSLLVPDLLPLGLLLSVAAFVAPARYVSAAAKRRRARIDAEVPQLLDLLAACSTAGLSAQLALRRAATGVAEPLAGELDRVLAAVELGARWRDELKAMADRLDLLDLKRAVVSMSRTEVLGTPLAESLRERAEEVRESRRAAAAETARKAPVKMLFPLVFLVLPAFLLLTVVPVLIATLRSIQ